MQSLFMQSQRLRVAVLPGVGGKISRIEHDGRELLVQPAHEHETVPFGAIWTDFEISGMDECFPNIEATSGYPHDHGEWAYGTWNVAQSDGRSITLQRETPKYSARRTMHLVGDEEIKFAYDVLNTGNDRLRYLWAAHPLFDVSDGRFELTLPSEGGKMRVFPTGETGEWPMWHGVDLRREWPPAGTSLKMFILETRKQWCELRLSQVKIRLTFNGDDAKSLGIWFNNGGFATGTASRCIAVEPTTSASDRVGDALVERYPEIAPGERRQWSMQFKISRA